MLTELQRYSENNGYPVRAWQPITCSCGSNLWKLFSDDDEGGAFAECCKCFNEIDIFSSRRYVENVYQNICNCENDSLEIYCGQAFYDDFDDPRWSYVGAKCPFCKLTGVYVDWQER